MNKKDFIGLFASKGNFSTKIEAEKKLNSFLETIEEVLVKGEEVNFIGWGKWEVKAKPARVGRNPQTGKEIKIAAKKVVTFRVGKKLADKVK